MNPYYSAQLASMGLATTESLLGMPAAGGLAGQGVLRPEFMHLAGGPTGNQPAVPLSAMSPDPAAPKAKFDMNTLAMIGQALQGMGKRPKPQIPGAPGAVSVGNGQSINVQSMLPVGQALLPGMTGGM